MRKGVIVLFIALLSTVSVFGNPPSRSTGERTSVVRSQSRDDRQFDPIQRIRQLVRKAIIHITPTDEMPTPPHP